MLVHYRVPPALTLLVTIHTPRQREALSVRIRCLAEGHHAVSPARVNTCTAPSTDEHTNHEGFSELDVAIAGVANETKIFPLVTNFSKFSLEYFCLSLNLKA